MDKKEKRLSEFRSWIKGFVLYHKQIKKDIQLEHIDKAAEILNDRYWEYAESAIRPIIADDQSVDINLLGESKISRFKIASAMELTIIDRAVGFRNGLDLYPGILMPITIQ